MVSRIVISCALSMFLSSCGAEGQPDESVGEQIAPAATEPASHMRIPARNYTGASLHKAKGFLCQDCHGTPSAYPWELTDIGEALRIDGEIAESDLICAEWTLLWDKMVNAVSARWFPDARRPLLSSRNRF